MTEPAAVSRAVAPEQAEPPVLPRPANAEEALVRLREGNDRFASGTPLHPNRSVELRQHLADGQAPYVAVLACADSRVTPELVFDCGIGELFVCRVAGAVLDPSVVASLYFAVEVLGVEVMLVLGHTACGAVRAAVDAVTGHPVPPELRALVESVRPAVEDVAQRPGATRSAGGSAAELDRLTDRAVGANVERVMGQLVEDPLGIGAAVSAGRARLVGGVLDLRSGLVSWVR